MEMGNGSAEAAACAAAAVEGQFVDPSVSCAKFDEEIAAFHALGDEYLRRGWWLLRAEFPQVFVVFATPQVKPATVPFGVVVDFTNYDVWAPSVKLVNPFTREPYKRKELPTTLPRSVPAVLPPGVVMPIGMTPRMPQDMMQAFDLEDVPFLCLPGVREYHDNPAHSGDSWLLHRGKGEGTLHFVLNTLYKYGIEPITGYNVQMVPSVTGLMQGMPPE